MIVEQGTPQPAHNAQPVAGRLRLAVIGAVVVLAVAIGAVLGTMLVSGRGASLARAADYVPSDAVMYAEVRLDLPGDQRANLRAILDRFPAVNADDILTEALADTLDSVLADGNAPFDYSTDIATWFDGTVAFAMLDYPSTTDPMQMQLPGFVALFGVRDAAAATSLADTLRGELEADGASFASSDHGGVTVWSLTVEMSGSTQSQTGQGWEMTTGTMPMAGVGFAYAVADDQLILGSGAESVEAALDTASGGESLPGSDEVSRLLAELPDDRVGVSVLNSAAMLAQLRADLEANQPEMAMALAPYLDAVPPVSVGALSLQADAVVFDGASAVPTGPTAPANASRDLAAMVPADAILFADGANVGASLERMVAAMKAALAAAPDVSGDGLGGLEQVEAALGADLEELVSWIGSGGFAVGWDGELVYAGAVLEATDPSAAERRLAQLGALAELAASDPSSGITVSTDTVAGVEVTTIAMAVSGAPAFDVPFAPAIQYAVDGDRVLIGLGDRFVENALTQDAADSLASSDRYTAAIERFGGADNAGSFFLDLAALRDAVEKGMGVDQQPMYGMVRPNVEPFDYVAGVTRVDGDRVISRMGLVVR